MKILIKYCNNTDFIASFPKNFFDFCYIDPPYNTKVDWNKSHIDSFEKSEWVDFITETIMLSRKKMNYINFNFMSLGVSNFLLNCLLASKCFYSNDKTDLLLWKRSFVPTSTYLDNFEYLFCWSVRKEKRVNKKRHIFYSKPLKYSIGTSSNWLCLERVFCGAKLKEVDFFFEDRHITRATVNQETLQTLASQQKLKLVNKKLYGLWTTDKFDKCKKFIQDFSYLQSNRYQKKYLGERIDLFFKFAKPYELIFYLLHFHHTEDTKNIVDYFCGSGSTADAVIRYNYQYKKSFDCYMCDINQNLKEHHKIRFKYVFDELKITDYEIIENEPNELLINYSFSAAQMPQTQRI